MYFSIGAIMICPVCGSDEDKISTITKNSEHHWFGIPFSYQQIINTCSWCGSEGDFTGMNDIKITEAMDAIRNKYGQEYIEDIMEQHKLSAVSIDRLLGLDIGSTGKMLTNDIKQMEFLFFRMLKEYPQVLRVIERWKIKT
jgi:hypothetical protein